MKEMVNKKMKNKNNNKRLKEIKKRSSLEIMQIMNKRFNERKKGFILGFWFGFFVGFGFNVFKEMIMNIKLPKL